MSVAGWKCADCGGEGYHFNLCPAWLRLLPDPRDAEITALRAALDQQANDHQSHVEELEASIHIANREREEAQAALDQERERSRKLARFAKHAGHEGTCTVWERVRGIPPLSPDAPCSCGLSELLAACERRKS